MGLERNRERMGASNLDTASDRDPTSASLSTLTVLEQKILKGIMREDEYIGLG